VERRNCLQPQSIKRSYIVHGNVNIKRFGGDLRTVCTVVSVG